MDNSVLATFPLSLGIRYHTGGKVKGKGRSIGLFDTDAYWHIVSLPVTEFTPSPQEALHTKQA
jgi:hypothetical protein